MVKSEERQDRVREREREREGGEESLQPHLGWSFKYDQTVWSLQKKKTCNSDIHDEICICHKYHNKGDKNKTKCDIITLTLTIIIVSINSPLHECNKHIINYNNVPY